MPESANEMVRPRPQPSELSVRGQRTRTKLVDAAAVVFARSGYAQTNATMISAEAGVSYGSFYVYFASKAEIFNEVIARLNSELYSRIRAPRGTPLAERIAYENEEFFRAYRDNAGLHQLMEDVARTQPEVRDAMLAMRHEYTGRLARNLRRMQRSGELDSAVDAAALAYALGGMAERLAYFAATDDLDDAELLHALNTVWLRSCGLPAPPPRTGSKRTGNTEKTA